MQYEYLFADRKRIGSNIEAIMKDRKCTKVTLSQAMNLSRPTLDAFLKGDIHNAGKYDEYIRRLLAYMQINDSVLDTYKTLPEVKKMRCNFVKKNDVCVAIRGCRIPIIHTKSYANAIQDIRELVAAGKRVIAISKMTADWARILSEATEQYNDVVFGCTDISNKEEAGVCVDAGAQFIISVSPIKEIGVFCKARDVFCGMNVSTVSGMIAADELGADIICLYPVEDITDNMFKAMTRIIPISRLAGFGLNVNSVELNADKLLFASLYIN